MNKSAVIALLFASVSAIKIGEAPGEERDLDEKPAAADRPKDEKKAAKDMGPPAEKVSFVDPVINREYTTFYAQQEQPQHLAAVFFDKAAGVWR